MWRAFLLGLVLGLAGQGEVAGEAGAASKPVAEPVVTRPVCGKRNRGQLWPAEANGNPRLANQLAREGRLAMCQKSNWHYGWKSPSVHIRQLAEEYQRTQ